ncbi:MAG TPA: fumarate hydratase [Candidatus Bathyarchaeota archaeon]|nr:fumarate hydratase [Candidatus Bathyarchaeota archaeon]
MDVAVYKLRTPISEEDVRRLQLGDVIYISGIMVTARDSAHRRAMEILRAGGSLPVDLRGGVLYHCGPVVKKVGEEWRVVAAGPTTSIRMEPFEAEFIKLTGVRVIVGKGGMGADTTRACKEYGAVYTVFTGGCGALAANAIKHVQRVEWLDLGVPEALWVFEVEEFGPLVVTIDAHGNNFHERISAEAERRKTQVYEMLGLK